MNVLNSVYIYKLYIMISVFMVVFGRWVSQYLPEKEGRDLQQFLGNQEHIDVESRQYDWLLNKL